MWKGTGETYPDRTAWNRWMGPNDACDQCYGRGFVLAPHPDHPEDDEDYVEKYCECPCGQLKRKLEGD